jgi:hypothetical protein
LRAVYKTTDSVAVVSASGPPDRDEDLTSEGTASMMADKRRATSDREKNDGNE